MAAWVRRNFTLDGVRLIGSILIAAAGLLWAVNSRYCALVYADQAHEAKMCVLDKRVADIEEERQEDRRMLRAIYQKVVRK